MHLQLYRIGHALDTTERYAQKLVFRMTLSLLILALLTPAALFAGDAVTMALPVERYLLPVVVEDVPGANGSLWSSEVWVNVLSVDGVSIGPLTIADFNPFRSDSIRLPTYHHRAGEPPGTFVTVIRSAAEDRVEFNLRIRDLSRQRETWGTEIPVVHENELRTAAFSLLPIPIDEEFRSTLRLYGSSADGGTVRVRILTLDDKVTRYDQIVTLAPPSHPVFSPAYAEIALHLIVPPAADRLLRVDILPVDGTPVWAFASVTHNRTQHVTTVTP